MMEFLKLFIVALMPVLKLLLLTSVGIVVSLNRFDIMSHNARKQLNILVFFVFSPTLVSSSIAKSITLRSMVMLWFMPLNILLTYIFGSALGWLLIKITRVPSHLQGLVLGCCSTGNFGNLMFILLPAVCKESGNLFGAMDVCYKNALAYSSLSIAVGNVCMWSYTYNIIRMYSCKENSNSAPQVDDSKLNFVSSKENEAENTSKCSLGTLITVDDRTKTNDVIVEKLETECEAPNGQPKVTRKANMMKQLKRLAEKINMKALFAPSSIGAIVGLVIGGVPQFRKVLIGDNAPLRVVQDSATILGGATIPALTLILGANLLKGFRGPRVHLPITVGIVVVRFVALPAIGIGIVKAAIHFGLIHHPDPLYHFVLLLQFAVPPALAISTVTQLFGAGEGECSVIMLATYFCAAVFLTLWCTLFMWLVLGV